MSEVHAEVAARLEDERVKRGRAPGVDNPYDPFGVSTTEEWTAPLVEQVRRELEDA